MFFLVSRSLFLLFSATAPGMDGGGMEQLGMGQMGGGAGFPGMNPEMMMQLMQDPYIERGLQELVNNPQVLRSVLDSNPALQQMLVRR